MNHVSSTRSNNATTATHDKPNKSTFQAVSIPQYVNNNNFSMNGFNLKQSKGSKKNFLRFKCNLNLNYYTINNGIGGREKHHIVFEFVMNEKPRLQFKSKSHQGNRIDGGLTKKWKLKTLHPHKIDLVVTIKTGKEILGRSSINFLALATGPTKYNIDIQNREDLNSPTGTADFNIEIEEIRKKTKLKLDITPNLLPTTPIKLDAGLYCTLYSIPDYSGSGNVIEFMKNEQKFYLDPQDGDTEPATEHVSLPLLDLHSESWNFDLEFKSATIKNLSLRAFFLVLRSTMYEDENENPPNPSTNPASSSIFKLELIFPTHPESSTVSFRTTLVSHKNSSVIGDIDGTANWINLPIFAQMLDASYTSSEGIKGGRVIKGEPQLFGPLHQSMLHCTLAQMMNSQRVKYPDLNIPYILDYFSSIILNGDPSKFGDLFRDNLPMSFLHEKVWEIEKLGVSEFSPVEASILIKLWLKAIPEPIIPKSSYSHCIEIGRSSASSSTASSSSSSSKKEIRSLFNSLPDENMAVLGNILYLCKVIVLNRANDPKQLATFLATNICRCPTPEKFFDLTKYEIKFVEKLIMYALKN
eukprot:TRINITY_DN1069_c3_g1_i1.p1 TRINITY_DN1069_c3_g1~~TRINITY_DN1069_c3_g1_i1.p1  ORF type:complete len:645 (-),score=178.04 TRINITY_DN1069_c3_g1_i1:269-2017(-)